MTTKPKVCYYHFNCYDGLGAAWSVWKHAPDFTFQTIDYQNDSLLPKEAVDGAVIMVVDFSFTPEVTDAIIQRAAAFTLLDHHPRTHEYIRELMRSSRYKDWGYELEAYSYDADWIQVVLSSSERNGNRRTVHLEYDLHRSGAQMTWEHMVGSKFTTPSIIRHMSDYDRWKFELVHTKEVMTGLGQYPVDLEVYKTFMDEPGLCARLVREAPALMQMRSAMVDNIIATTCRMTTLLSHTVPVINCPKVFTSEALQRLSKDYPFAIGYYESETGRHISLRSRKDGGADVSQIAQQLGGGGHVHAAGINVLYTTDEPLQKILLYM